MKAVAVFSRPEGRRRIPDPCLDAPAGLAQLVGNSFKMDLFSEKDLQSDLVGIFKTGAWDATPHICAGDKLALHSMAAGRNFAFLWEGATAKNKRQLIHIETLAGISTRYSGGVPLTPAVMWGLLEGVKFPGEGSLVDDHELAKTHLSLLLRLAKSSGYPSQHDPIPRAEASLEQTDITPASAKTQDAMEQRAGGGVPESLTRRNETPHSSSPEHTVLPEEPSAGAGEGPEVPPAGIGFGYFAWLRDVIDEAREGGPLGRGWGRVTEEKRAQYFSEGGRMDPGAVRIRGFVFATTEGQSVFFDDDEKKAIRVGLNFLENAKFSTNLIVEDTRSFKTFTLGRAALRDVRLPSWIFFPHGRGWLTDLAQFCPAGENDPVRWILRGGVSQGLKTCSPLIAEPSLGLLGEEGNPSISAKSFLGAVSVSPYFSSGRDKAPDLWRGIRA
jgi:hypothetical protein